MQTTNNVLMIRPTAFHANPETMQSNFFQKTRDGMTDISLQAQLAFDAYVDALRQTGVEVTVIHDISGNETPDSLFPNNWISMLEGETIFTFPMEALNRRRERREDIIAQIRSKFVVNKRIDLSPYESKGLFFEGTGSLILDHDNKLAYVCRSSRSAAEVGQDFEKLSGYRIFWFDAKDRDSNAIYHTNVMMSLGTKFAIVCLESVACEKEREQLIALLEGSGKTIIDVSFAQMESFTCNVLELKNSIGHPVYALSTRAWNAFSAEQQNLISNYADLALAPIDIIEDLGGGGARCMIAEIFLEKQYLTKESPCLTFG